jgi:DNA-binding transcriptional LysR family regulator
VELRQLRYLVAIAEEGNLGRAAASLYVSQPALSYALRSLESELGVRLFDRHAGGVTATPAGRDVVSEARRALWQADQVTAAAERHRRGAAGVLRVGFEASESRRCWSRWPRGPRSVSYPTSMARYYTRPDLVWVPLTDVDPLRVALAWVEGAETALVRGFAEVVRELAASGGESG